jgi:hypothetical protein
MQNGRAWNDTNHNYSCKVNRHLSNSLAGSVPKGVASWVIHNPRLNATSAFVIRVDMEVSKLTPVVVRQSTMVNAGFTQMTNLNVLPLDLIPEGWQFEKIQWAHFGTGKKFHCWIDNTCDKMRKADLAHSAVGDSPFEALMGAITKLKEARHVA